MHSTNTSNPVDFPSWEDMSPLEQAQCQFWDMYKDAYGFRPRGIDTSTWTLEQFQEEFVILARPLSVKKRLARPPKPKLSRSLNSM